MDYDIKAEFGKRAKGIRLHFGLSQIDVANLSGMSNSEYSDLENGTTNYNVEKIQSVSSVYGLTYYHLGNPNSKFPPLSKLPEKTSNVIRSRKNPVKIYNDRLIVEHLTIVFSGMPENSEFLISTIDSKIQDLFSKSYDKEEISGTIAKNFNGFILKTTKKQIDKKGPGAKPFYYKVIKQLPNEEIERAKEVFANEEMLGDKNED